MTSPDLRPEGLPEGGLPENKLGVPASPSGCQPSASAAVPASSRSGTPNAEPRFLLVKRGLYYRPDSRGYTGAKEQAGRYYMADASPENGVVAVHETDAPEYAPGCFHDLAAAHMARRVKTLGDALADLLAGRVRFPAQAIEARDAPKDSGQ